MSVAGSLSTAIRSASSPAFTSPISMRSTRPAIDVADFSACILPIPYSTIRLDLFRVIAVREHAHIAAAENRDARLQRRLEARALALDSGRLGRFSIPAGVL